MTWRVRRNSGSIWDYLTRDFSSFDEMIDRMWSEVQKDPDAQTWYYGYQVSLGPDGKPHVKEFGNIRPQGGQLQLGAREPLIDVSVDDKEGVVKIVAEMPGANKESIKINATEVHVKITSNHLGKPYNAEIPLSTEVDPNTAEATYTNGMLQIVFKKKRQELPKGVNVKVK
jgi:HSP20 family protein